MTAHSEYCRCHRCEIEGIEEANPEAAEQHAEDKAAERADRQLAAADARYENHSELWGDAPW